MSIENDASTSLISYTRKLLLINHAVQPPSISCFVDSADMDFDEERNEIRLDDDQRQPILWIDESVSSLSKYYYRWHILKHFEQHRTDTALTSA